jgi:hypothetical protein
MTGIMPEADATYRIQAMNNTDVFERLKLASFHADREKRDRLRKRVGHRECQEKEEGR